MGKKYKRLIEKFKSVSISSVVIGLDFSSSFSGGVTKIYSRDSLISADNKTTAAAPPQGCLPATPRAGSPTPNHCYFPTALLPPSHT